MKKTISLILVVCVVLFSFQVTVVAKSSGTEGKKYSEKPTQGIESPYPDYGECYMISGQFSTSDVSTQEILLSGDNFIEELSSNMISGYAATITNEAVDTVGYIMKFQIWDGYDWVTFSDAVKERYDFVRVQGYHDRTVSPGYYYRIEVIHYYENDGEFDAIVSHSKYIYVD